jgi:hypothetical protein
MAWLVRLHARRVCGAHECAYCKAAWQWQLARPGGRAWLVRTRAHGAHKGAYCEAAWQGQLARVRGA